MLGKRRQQMVIFTGIGIVGIVLTSFVLWQALKTQWFKRYTNDEYGFSMKYPALWTMPDVSRLGAAAAFLSPQENALDIFRENVNIVVQRLPAQRLSLAEYSDIAVKQMVIVFRQTMEIISTEQTTWAGRPAFKFIYYGKDSDKRMKFMHVWFIENGLVYQFNYSALDSGFNKYLGIVEKMLQSFRLK